jgi:hypothetical protein
MINIIRRASGYDYEFIHLSHTEDKYTISLIKQNRYNKHN